MKLGPATLLLAAATLSPLAAAAAPVTLVVCAPGYPGTTSEAQPAMDAFATALGKAAGYGEGSLGAIYYPTEEAGLARLQKDDATLALVPLPFYLSHRKELQLSPRAQVVPQEGTASETWTLVAAKGRVHSAADLDGWQIQSLAGYVPRFVRVALADWGALPASTRIVPSGAVLSGLRRAAAGEPVAVLLDSTQAQALPSVPFAKDLEVLATSRAVPGSLFCAVGTRLAKPRLQATLAAIVKLEARPDGTAALAGLRLTRFVALDAPGLARVEKAFDAARP